MASIQQRTASDALTVELTRLSAFDARLMRQQAPLLAVTHGQASSASLLNGDVILQAELKSGQGRDLLFTLEAGEALELAKQLIASASNHLKKSNGC